MEHNITIDDLGKSECSRCGSDPYMEPWLKSRVATLEAEVARLEDQVSMLKQQPVPKQYKKHIDRY